MTASFKKPARWLFPLLGVAMVFIGFGAMAGVLNYTNHHPINVWLPLAVFAFVPLLLTVFSAYCSLVASPSQIEHGHPWLMFVVNTLKLRSFLPYKNVLLPWLFWQTQTFALLFSMSTLLSFFLLATFQDYHFGWSSTLITDNTTMVNVMRAVSWPWYWLVDSPSAELIRQTRFSAQSTQFSVVDEHWWTTLVMAIVVYGILPRFLLALYLRQVFVRTLKRNIASSGDIEKFLAAQQHQASLNPIEFDGELALPEAIDIKQAHVALVAWQQPTIDLPIIKNLGSSDWLDDEHWLNSSVSVFDNPVWVVVDLLQTPTGELADCIELLQKHNSSVTLVLLSESDKISRYEQQLKSWLYFAKRHSIDLKRGHANG